jgi:hypothetical protein
MDTDSSEIKTLKRVVWRTAIAGRLERFSALLNDPAKQQHFGESFINRLSSKLDRLFRLQLVLAAVYLILMLSLFVAQDPKKTEFQILGYSFKNLGYYKELLLFVAALLTPTSSIVAAYHRYLGELRKAALSKLFPEQDVREFSAHIYSDNFLDSLLGDRAVSYRRPHGVTTLLVAVFGMTLVALALALIAASFVLQISVIYDVTTNPSFTRLLNRFIVAFSLGAIALSWMVGALQLPLPEVDVEASVRLGELQKQDPLRYQETMKRIAADSARRERTWFVATGVLIFASVYSLFAAFFPHSSSVDLWRLLLMSVPGLAMTIFISTTVAGGIKRAIYRAYFRKYPEGSDSELKAFTRTTRIVSACRVGVLVVGSVVFSFLMLGAK